MESGEKNEYFDKITVFSPSFSKLEQNNETLEIEEKEKDNEDEGENKKIELKKNYEIPTFHVQDEYVNLSNKNLNFFHDDLFKFKNLKRINLSKNLLTSLPYNLFSFFTSLKWLDLRENKINFLPIEGLEDHPSLQVLLLDKNNLHNLPCQLGAIESLINLSIKDNLFVYPPPEIISKGFKNVKEFLFNDWLESCDVSRRKKELEKIYKMVEEEEKASKVKVMKNFNKNTNTNAKISKKIWKPEVGETQEQVSEALIEEKFKEDLKMMKKKIKKIKQDAILQSMKNLTAISEWKNDYKLRQRELMERKHLNGGWIDFTEPARSAPYGINRKDLRIINNYERIKNNLKNIVPLKPENLSPEVKFQIEMAKKKHEIFLTKKAESQINLIKERNYGNLEPQEALLQAKSDLEMATKLYEEIKNKERELGFNMTTLPLGIV